MKYRLLRLRAPFAVPAVAVLAAIVALSGCQGPSSSSASPTTPSTAGTTTTDPTTTIPPTTTTVPPTTTTVPVTTTTTRPPVTIPKPVVTVPRPPPADVLQVGGVGPNVMALQQQLTTLGYWLGPVNGQFGSLTQQAVFALQKAAGLPRTGSVNAATGAALAAGTLPTPKSTTGHVIEVNLTTDLVLFVTNGHVDNVLNTSTGGGYVFHEHGVREVAITPTGQFATYREVNGTDISPLGTLWRPKFFVGGFAIHGDSYVPAHPVSHGCVRVTDAAMNWIWTVGNDPIGTPVWVY